MTYIDIDPKKVYELNKELHLVADAVQAEHDNLYESTMAGIVKVVVANFKAFHERKVDLFLTKGVGGLMMLFGIEINSLHKVLTTEPNRVEMMNSIYKAVKKLKLID